jgi:hypothetical protein
MIEERGHLAPIILCEFEERLQSGKALVHKFSGRWQDRLHRAEVIDSTGLKVGWIYAPTPPGSKKVLIRSPTGLARFPFFRLDPSSPEISPPERPSRRG